MRLAARAVLLVFSLTIWALSAEAQHTGGSFGSSQDDEDHHGGSGSGSGSGSESESGGRPSSDDHWDWEPTQTAGSSHESDDERRRRERLERRGPRDERASPALVNVGLVLVGLLIIGLPIAFVSNMLLRILRAFQESRAMRAVAEAEDQHASWNNLRAPPRTRSDLVSTHRISLAFGPEARHVLQDALRNASGQEMRGDAARLRVLDGMLGLFQVHAHAVAYACVTSMTLTDEEARRTTRALANDLRARYRADTVGPNRTSAPTLRAREEEGDGLVVVSVLVTRNAPVLLKTPQTRAEVATLLDTLLAERSSVSALDVIWSPSEENDRLSSYELEHIYSELVRIAEATSFGAMTCPACRGALPRELAFCPHCGRPTRT